MRPDSPRLGVLVIVACCALPGSARAQVATSTDAAIAELRRLIADQGAALDRQSRIIEEQGRLLTALQQQVEGTKPSAGERREPEPVPPAALEAQAPAGQPGSRTAAGPAPDLPVGVVAAGDFPGSIRIPGTEAALI